jgi:LEA14-like dessication related protein
MKFISNKHLINSIIIFIIIGFFFTSCAPIKPIEYKYVDNFSISEMSLNPEVKVDVHLNNPNSVGAKIKEIKIDVYVNNVELSSVCIDGNKCVRAKGDFIIPVAARVSFIDIAKLLPNGIGSFFGDKEIPVNIKGSVTIKKFIFSKTFTIDYSEKLTKDKIKMLGN